MTSPESPNLRTLITAGPTHEPIDAVRFLGNRSSGRMGLALARAADDRGWPGTLLLGPGIELPLDHSHLQIIRFHTAADLEGLLADLWPHHDVLLMAAAVSDYRPGIPQEGKLRRVERSMTLELEPTPDLLASLKEGTRPDQTVVGFALEPQERLLDSAEEKLGRKGLDMIVANPLETMDAETISATLLRADGGVVHPDPNLPKLIFAGWLLDQVELWREECRRRRRKSPIQ